jgi:lipid-binding SYLF domain-containing protein
MGKTTIHCGQIGSNAEGNITRHVVTVACMFVYTENASFVTG